MKLLPRRNVSLYTAKTETDNHKKIITLFK